MNLKNTEDQAQALDKREVGEKIQELSNKVHQETLRGGAELILLSERAYEAIEDDVVFNEYKNRFIVMNPGEWQDPPMAPCDIRAIYFGGMLEYEISEEKSESQSEKEMNGYKELQIPEIDLQYSSEEVDSTVEEYTFEK